MARSPWPPPSCASRPDPPHVEHRADARTQRPPAKTTATSTSCGPSGASSTTPRRAEGPTADDQHSHTRTSQDVRFAASTGSAALGAAMSTTSDEVSPPTNHDSEHGVASSTPPGPASGMRPVILTLAAVRRASGPCRRAPTRRPNNGAAACPAWASMTPVPLAEPSARGRYAGSSIRSSSRPIGGGQPRRASRVRAARADTRRISPAAFHSGPDRAGAGQRLGLRERRSSICGRPRDVPGLTAQPITARPTGRQPCTCGASRSQVSPAAPQLIWSATLSPGPSPPACAIAAGQFDGGTVRRPAPGAGTLPRPLAARAGNRRDPHSKHGPGLVPRSRRGGGRGLAGGQPRGLIRTSGLAHPRLRVGRPRTVGRAPLHWRGLPCRGASSPGPSH